MRQLEQEIDNFKSKKLLMKFTYVYACDHHMKDLSILHTFPQDLITCRISCCNYNNIILVIDAHMYTCAVKWATVE